MDEWYYQVPCIHRIHDSRTHMTFPSAHSIQMILGMSIEKDSLITKLETLEADVTKYNERTGKSTRALVTFDDGYRDILCLRSYFQEHRLLQPVLFVSSALISTGQFENWFDILYSIAVKKYQAERSWESMFKWLSEEREKLRNLRNVEQLSHLRDVRDSSITLPSDLYLTKEDITKLSDAGFNIASHGWFHHDLTMLDDRALSDELEEAISVCKMNSYMPWLAWPDGRFDERTIDAGREVGFQMMFDIEGSSIDSTEDIVSRTIW